VARRPSPGTCKILDVSEAHAILDGEIAWRPTPAYIDNSRIKGFMDANGIGSYEALLARSVNDPEWFWPAVLDAIGIEFFEPYTQIVDLGRGPAWPRWCVGGRMNIVHSCLDKWQKTATADRPALHWEGEEGATRSLTYRELHALTNRCANGLRSLGLAPGDRVGLFMPMCPELVAVFFAVVRVGGVVLPLFSGYGVDAVRARLQDAEARFLVTADGFWRRGQRVGMRQTADAAVAACPNVERVIVVPRLGDEALPAGGRHLAWPDLVGPQSDQCVAERTAADATLMLLYTSGTTGRPKGAVHTHCGFPIKAAQDMMHALDVHAGETMYWVSDIGWMMAPWELFGMALLGGTSVLYDGALDYPGPDRLWSLVERHRVNILGVSPTLIRSLMRHGDRPVRQHDLTSLRILGSTGEPWNPEPWRWFFDVVGGGRLPIINYSGGTEVSGGLLAGCVLTPLKPAAFSGPPPGIAADVVDERGQPVRNQVGELVVRAPWMGMTQGFWRDDARYEETYWSRFPGIWVHGDWAAIDGDGLWYVLGRSDDTIKIAGKRLGPAEVESVLVEHPAVLEAAAIGIPDEVKGQALACFCVLRPGHTESAQLKTELRALVVERLGKPLRPEVIHVVSDLPKTRNAKVMRRVIRAAYLGRDAGDLSSLENPRAVDAIAEARRAARG
jgi:acetyl-CoA synthetase